MQYYSVRNKIAMLRNGRKNDKTNTIGQKEHKDTEDCPCSLSEFTPASSHVYFSNENTGAPRERVGSLCGKEEAKLHAHASPLDPRCQ